MTTMKERIIDAARPRWVSGRDDHHLSQSSRQTKDQLP